ncbi:MAG: hypothetical protein Q9181_008010 [Wetmoreana brouardii]
MGRVMDRIMQMIAGSGSKETAYLLEHTQSTDSVTTGFKKHRDNASANSSSAHTRSNSDASLESCVTLTGPTVTSTCTRPIKIRHRIDGDERFLYPKIDIRHDYGFVARGQQTKADAQSRNAGHHQLILKESRERYEDLLAKQADLSEEERMIDWAREARYTSKREPGEEVPSSTVLTVFCLYFWVQLTAFWSQDTIITSVVFTHEQPTAFSDLNVFEEMRTISRFDVFSDVVGTTNALCLSRTQITESRAQDDTISQPQTLSKRVHPPASSLLD